MNKPKMIESENDFCCQNNHGQPIHLVVLDPKIEKKQRLLCIQCLENFKTKAKTIGLKKLIKDIEDAIEKKMSNLADNTSDIIQKINKYIASAQEYKAYFMKLCDSIIRIAEDWTQDLFALRQQYNQYSFYDELDKIIMNEKIKSDSDKLIDNINISWMTKLYNNLNQFNQDQNKLSFKAIKQQFIKIFSSNLSQKCEIKFKLIDQSIKQNDRCNVIVFDSSGSIMVSTQQKDIKVWSFLNGTIKLVKTLQGHSNWIQCLVYSKKQNSFISGDKTIRCWQQLNQNDWISSQFYQQHTDYIRCIILNSNEDLLFSGSKDKSIKVWKVDFNQNQLTFLYSLDKHNNQVMSLSLNQSENQLVSCAEDQNQIIIWERRENDQFKFKYFVKQSIQEQGKNVKFINENQFIWVTGGQQIDQLYVFEQKQGVFQENQEKTIQLITNNQLYDNYRFPIIYNKERNLILVRHKTYMYIIREINDGKYKIYDYLNCDTNDFYGTITNNGQYLVYWDDKKKGYSTYELFNQ